MVPLDGRRPREASAAVATRADPDARARTLLQAGDAHGAAAEAIRVHGPSVREYLRAVLRDHDAADDAFSLFEEWTLASIAKYLGTSTLRAWCFGVAQHAARRTREEAWRRHRVRMRSDPLALDARTPPSSGARREGDLRRLEELRRSLSAGEQSLLSLRLDRRLEWREIADVLSRSGDAVTVGALRKRFERLKARIGRLARGSGILD